jgi:hypothetical protein
MFGLLAAYSGINIHDLLLFGDSYHLIREDATMPAGDNTSGLPLGVIILGMLMYQQTIRDFGIYPCRFWRKHFTCISHLY